jgi:O-methyltransferase involved in polyketide biosynthesis
VAHIENLIILSEQSFWLLQVCLIKLKSAVFDRRKLMIQNQTRESTQQLLGAAETLLFTLYARALETQRSNPLFRDQKALEIQKHLDYDFSKLDGAWKTLAGAIVRTIEIDRVVEAFIAQHPDSVAINLASGLCTRYFRMNAAQLHWYEVDFPEVIELRRRFLRESEHYHFVSSSVLEFDWMSQIQRNVDQPILIIMEGLTMYLTEEENRALIRKIRHCFAPVEMIFDVHSRGYAPSVKTTDAVTRTSAVLKSGLDSAKEIETWTPGIKVLSETSLSEKLALYPQRLPWWIRPIRHWLFRFQPKLREVWRLIHLEISQSIT